MATAKKVTKKKVTRRRGSNNYLNNANLLEQIALSKEVLHARQDEARAQGLEDGDDGWPTMASCVNNELVKMIMMLVERYGQKANWRGYTYIDDMKSEAMVSLLNGCLKFDPEKSKNPFGYMTQIVTHSFLTTLEKEKKVRMIRDDILEQNGFTPSHTRQLENEAGAMERRRKMSDELDLGTQDASDDDVQ